MAAEAVLRVAVTSVAAAISVVAFAQRRLSPVAAHALVAEESAD
jgi:hypothetical protein